METNLLKNAIRNTKASIENEKSVKPQPTLNEKGLLSRTKSSTMSDKPREHDSVRLAKMMKGYFNNG